MLDESLRPGGPQTICVDAKGVKSNWIIQTRGRYTGVSKEAISVLDQHRYNFVHTRVRAGFALEHRTVNPGSLTRPVRKIVHCPTAINTTTELLSQS